jgi:hypothetical protein
VFSDQPNNTPGCAKCTSTDNIFGVIQRGVGKPST